MSLTGNGNQSPLVAVISIALAASLAAVTAFLGFQGSKLVSQGEEIAGIKVAIESRATDINRLETAVERLNGSVENLQTSILASKGAFELQAANISEINDRITGLSQKLEGVEDILRPLGTPKSK